MSKFEIQYKIGAGHKTRKFIIEYAIDKMDASLIFQKKAPPNAYVLQIDVVKMRPKPVSHFKNRVHYKMKIENSFDQFLFDTLQKKESNNQKLGEYLGITRAKWKYVRQHPEQLGLYDLIKISQFFDAPIEEITALCLDIIFQNIESKTLHPLRGKPATSLDE